MIRVTLNGKPRELPHECTVLALLEEREVNPVLVAVEHNGDIVQRERFGEVLLREGDTIEIVHMVGGGQR